MGGIQLARAAMGPVRSLVKSFIFACLIAVATYAWPKLLIALRLGKQKIDTMIEKEGLNQFILRCAIAVAMFVGMTYANMGCRVDDSKAATEQTMKLAKGASASMKMADSTSS